LNPRGLVIAIAEVAPQTSGQRLLFRSAQRLSLPNEFALALRARPVGVSQHFQVFCPQVPRSPRLGIVVGKRFVRRSVDRSTVKRLVRELFRTRRFELAKLDYLVRVRNPILALNKAATRMELRAELESLLQIAKRAA
jgi:ribonuclease P protein component